MNRYSHYGVEVVYQVIFDGSFKNELKKNGIEYMDLPILENVVRYEKDGEDRFAYIVPQGDVDSYCEKVYITSKIPLDMNWENLADDVDGQKEGRPAIAMPTKARILCAAAEKIVLEADAKEFSFDNVLDDTIDPVYFRQALISLGYSIEEVMEMEHSDVDADMLKSMCHKD